MRGLAVVMMAGLVLGCTERGVQQPVYVPGAPRELRAAALPDSAVLLTWLRTTLQADGFELWESPDSGATFYVRDTLAMNTDRDTLRGVDPRRSVRYKLRAFNTNGFSPFSNSAGVVDPRVAARLSSPNSGSAAWDAALASEGDLLLVARIRAEGRGVVEAWDLPSRSLRFNLDLPAGPHVVAVHPSGEFFAVGFRDSLIVKVYSSAGALLRSEPVDTTAQVTALAFRPDGERLAAAVRVWGWDSDVQAYTYSHRLRLWNGEVTVLERDLAVGTGAATATDLSFSRDGALLAASYINPGASADSVVVWSGRDWRRLLTIRDLRGAYSLDFSPDGSRLAVVGADSAITVWDLATGARSGTLTDDTPDVRWVAYSPDGLFIASGAYITADPNWRLKIWNPTTFERFATLPAAAAYASQLNLVLWTPDGGRLVAVDAFEVVMWSVFR